MALCKKSNEKKVHYILTAYSTCLQRIELKQHNPYYLLGVNSSAEWMKNRKIKKKDLVKDMQLAVRRLPEQSDSNSDTTATNQWLTFSPQLILHARTEIHSVHAVYTFIKWP